MPCRSDYMEQTGSERRFQQTAKLLVILRNHLSLPTPQKFYKEANTSYAKNVGQVEFLCKTIRENRSAFETYLQTNLRSNQEARELADWWDEHEAEDRKREAQEAADYNRQKLVMAAMSKLTLEEIQALKESDIRNV